MTRHTTGIFILLLGGALAGCSDEKTGINSAGPTAMESVSILTSMAEGVRSANNILADDPTMSPQAARAAHTMSVTLGSGADRIQAIYNYQETKWVSAADAVIFPDNKRQPVAISLKKSGPIIQDGSAQALIDADQLEWTRENQVPVRELANVPMTHAKTLVEFELGSINATQVVVGNDIKAYHVENGNKWQAIIEPMTQRFIVSVTVNGSISTAEVWQNNSPTDSKFLADHRYTVPLVLNGAELIIGTVGVGTWNEGVGGTAEAVPPTLIIIEGLENQIIDVYLADSNTPATLGLDASGAASLEAGVPMSTVTKIVCNGTEYLIGRPESGVIHLKIAGSTIVMRDADSSGSIPINTIAELKLIASNTSSKFIQTGNIDLMNEEWTPVPNFSGSYDGGNFSISNLKISLGNGNAGFFASNSGTIKNVTIASASALKGEWHSGFVCGENKGTIEGCTNKASITDGGANSLGGICGYNNQGTIRNCKNTGTLIIADLIPSDGTGGIVGYCGKGTITGCANEGKIDGKPAKTGGIAGQADGCEISDCYNNGELALPWGAGDNVGGIAGLTYNATRITRCYNTGKVTVEGSQAGGIAGQLNSGATISSCYNAGSMVGAKWNSGGIAGQSTDATIIACHNDGLVKCQTNGWAGAGGICGFHKGTIEACYNTGAIEGDSAIGAIVGEHNSGQIYYSFWSGDVVGIPGGGGGSQTGNAKFGSGNWPASSMHTGWKTTTEDPGAFWRTLGSAGGSYPKLNWEQN